MSLDTLPLEVLNLILFSLGDTAPPRISRLSDGPPPNQGLSCYAAISRKWQTAVERYTFAAVKTNSSDLAQLKRVVAKWPCRRNILKALLYQIDLPVYSASRSRCFERRREHQANRRTFQNGVQDLWEALSLWNDGDNVSSGLRLVLTAEAPVQFPEGLQADRWAYPEHSLTLDDAGVTPVLPKISCITALQVAYAGRRIHPAAIGTLLASLPNLQDLDLKIWPIQRQHRALVAEHITTLAQALESPTLARLEQLRIWLGQHTPGDHNYETALARDPSYPAGDVLNHAVFKLAQRSLRELYLDEAWMISPALWGVISHSSRMMARWLCTGDPNEVRPLEGDAPPPPREEPEPDSDSNSSFNSEVGDEIDDYHEEVLNGDEPRHPWRVKPDPDTFHPLACVLVAAVLRMPSLEHLKIGTTQAGAEYHEVKFEYLRPGRTADTVPFEDQTPEQREKWRWIVSLGLEASWELPEDIRELMERRMGEDGEVIFYQM
ncbi:hypothetical protein BJX76DRAFT_361966 [Aspergillus varians]